MFLISDNIDTLTGMRLAGVNGVVVHEEAEVRKALDDVFEDRGIHIVLITEKLADLISGYLDNIKLTRKYPLVVEIPDRHGTSRPPDFITRHVNESIGLKF